MGERHELTEDPALCADDDFVRITKDVPDPRTCAECCTCPQPARRTADHPLDQVVGIAAGEPLDEEIQAHAIN
ncbi:hypothetical protein [Bradyrhizobium canariense]|uniref:hypothetical protein n=1 Tax=Bradyrhizobium canariense TaxID=255045 RepID=UPI001FE2F0D3|nr:hypothetical protein [Bradyrhizobium canariense]